MRNFFGCYYRWFITSLALEKCKKEWICFKLFWYKIFVHWKSKLLNVLVDSVLICWYLVIHLGGVRLCESEVCHPKRQHNVLCNAFMHLEAVWLSGKSARLAIQRLQVQVPLWPLAGFVLGSPVLKFSTTVVNSHFAPGRLVFLTLLSLTEILFQVFSWHH